MPEARILTPTAAVAIDRMELGTTNARDAACIPMNIGLFSVGAQPACMADE